jgi:hypothetical protein
VSVVEYGAIGARAIAARQRAMELFAEFLGPGSAVAGDLPPPREVLSMLIAGGINEILSKYYIEGRLHVLPEALPAIAYLTVAPFFGLLEARRVASLPPSAAPLP